MPPTHPPKPAEIRFAVGEDDKVDMFRHHHPPQQANVLDRAHGGEAIDKQAPNLVVVQKRQPAITGKREEPRVSGDLLPPQMPTMRGIGALFHCTDSTPR